MPWLPIHNFKQGVKPSIRASYDMKQLTPSQKVTLARCRIWGQQLPDVGRSGLKVLKKPMKGLEDYHYYEDPFLELVYPGIKEWGNKNYKIDKFERRRVRVLMRGLKMSTLNIAKTQETMKAFEQGKKKEDKGDKFT